MHRPTPFFLRLVTILLLAVAILLPPTSGASNIPPKSPDYPQGVSSINPGSDLWREVRQRDGLIVDGISQVKGVETGVLINVRGDQWARFRINEVTKTVSYALVGVFGILVLVFVLRGKVGIKGGRSGRVVRRFTDYERIVHWTLTIVFLFLAITGLILLLGRPLLLPLFGKEVFALFASASKEGHNLFGPLFLVSLLMMLFSFTRHNIYEKGDLGWLLKLGGLIGDGHPSVGFFNMGEKFWYWIVILIGLVVSISGLILVSPNFGQGRVIMEISHLVHVIGALVLMLGSLGHMYMGTIGIEGALQGMTSGYVDTNWADAHHDRWSRECQQKGLTLSADEFARLRGETPAADAEVAAQERAK